MSKVILFGTAHLENPWIPGKLSPDKSFQEAVFSRELAKDLAAIMQSYGFADVRLVFNHCYGDECDNDRVVVTGRMYYWVDPDDR